MPILVLSVPSSTFDPEMFLYDDVKNVKSEQSARWRKRFGEFLPIVFPGLDFLRHNLNFRGKIRENFVKNSRQCGVSDMVVVFIEMKPLGLKPFFI